MKLPKSIVEFAILLVPMRCVISLIEKSSRERLTPIANLTPAEKRIEAAVFSTQGGPGDLPRTLVQVKKLFGCKIEESTRRNLTHDRLVSHDPAKLLGGLRMTPILAEASSAATR